MLVLSRRSVLVAGRSMLILKSSNPVVSYILTWLNHDWTKRRYFLHFIAISNFIVSLAVFFMPLLACSPPSDLWNFNNQSLDACAIVPYLNLTYFHGGMSNSFHPRIRRVSGDEGLRKRDHFGRIVHRSVM